MKKVILALFLILALLAGWWWFFSGKTVRTPSAREQAAEEQTPALSGGSAVEPGTASQKPSAKTAPSFEDGDYYLKAIAERDLGLCGKIGNTELKARCETGVKERAEKE